MRLVSTSHFEKQLNKLPDNTVKRIYNKLNDLVKKLNEHDLSNWSKIEREKNLPPSDPSTLEKWANELGIKKFSSDWYTFFDLAAAARGEIPDDLKRDENIVSKLPLFYRTLRGQKPTDKEMKNIAKLLKEY